MEVRGVATRVNNSQVYIWENAVQYAIYPTASSYTDVQVGDFVRFDANGQIERSPSNASIDNYRGVVVGLAPNAGEYPAFGIPFNHPLVAFLSPNKTELIMRQIDNNGRYLSTPTLKVNDTTAFVYNSSTRRWGVQPNGTNPATGRVVQILSDGRLLILFGA
jgi:hypothetical protein